MSKRSALITDYYRKRKRARVITNMSDVVMASSNSTKRMESAVKQVGQGLEVTVPRSVPHLYNNNYTVRLSYVDNFRHDVAQNGSSGSIQVFRANSIFDPDFTGTGHQPIFRDLWASQYDYYAVIQCDYIIRMYNASGQDPVTYSAVGTSGQTIGAVNVTMLATTNANDYVTGGIVFPAGGGR